MADYETNPILAAWKLLPPNVRQQYMSGVAGLAELSPGAAIRDTVQGIGDTTRSALSGEGWGTATNLAKTAGAAVGVIPGGKLAVQGVKKAAQEGVGLLSPTKTVAAEGLGLLSPSMAKPGTQWKWIKTPDGRQVEIAINPSEAEVRKIAKSSKYGGVRMGKDADGNYLAWDADFTHEHVAPSIGHIMTDGRELTLDRGKLLDVDPDNPALTPWFRR